MSLPLVYGFGVHEDVDDAFQWYEQQDEGLRERFLSALRERLASIPETPRLFPLVHRRIWASTMRTFPYVIY